MSMALQFAFNFRCEDSEACHREVVTMFFLTQCYLANFVGTPTSPYPWCYQKIHDARKTTRMADNTSDVPSKWVPVKKTRETESDRSLLIESTHTTSTSFLASLTFGCVQRYDPDVLLFHHMCYFTRQRPPLRQAFLPDAAPFTTGVTPK